MGDHFAKSENHIIPCKLFWRLIDEFLKHTETKEGQRKHQKKRKGKEEGGIYRWKKQFSSNNDEC